MITTQRIPTVGEWKNYRQSAVICINIGRSLHQCSGSLTFWASLSLIRIRYFFLRIRIRLRILILALFKEKVELSENNTFKNKF